MIHQRGLGVCGEKCENVIIVTHQGMDTHMPVLQRKSQRTERISLSLSLSPKKNIINHMVKRFHCAQKKFLMLISEIHCVWLRLAKNPFYEKLAVSLHGLSSKPAEQASDWQ